MRHAYTSLSAIAVYRQNLKLRCPRCRKVVIFSGPQLWWLFQRRRWEDRLRDVADRLYCRTCWGVDARKHRPGVTVTRDDPTDTSFAWPDEREWKRLVARYRT